MVSVQDRSESNVDLIPASAAGEMEGEMKIPAGATPRGLARPLLEAVMRSEERKVKILLKRGASANQTGGRFHSTLLNMAVASGNVYIVKRLLKHGADPNWTHPTDEDGVSHPPEILPLSTACANGSPALVELLLKHGAQLEKRNYRGETCLFHGVRSRDPSIVELLLSKGVRMNVENLYGRSPLEEARTWCPEVVDRLEGAERLQRLAERPQSQVSSAKPSEDICDASSDFSDTWDFGEENDKDREICDTLQRAIQDSMVLSNTSQASSEKDSLPTSYSSQAPHGTWREALEEDTSVTTVEDSQSEIWDSIKVFNNISDTKVSGINLYKPPAPENSEDMVHRVEHFSSPKSFADQFLNL